MFPQHDFDLEEMMKPGREAFEYWISFFPTAPLFGVEWRFGEMMPKPGMNGEAKKAAPPARKAKAAAPTMTPASPAPKKEAAAAPAPLSAPKVAEAVAPAKAALTVTKPAPLKPTVAKKAAPKKAGKTPVVDGRPTALLASKPAKVDNLKLIKGIGPGLEKELNGLGVYHFTQMAEFGKSDLEWIDANLTAFKGRCFRDDWTGQAKSLLAG